MMRMLAAALQCERDNSLNGCYRDVATAHLDGWPLWPIIPAALVGVPLVVYGLFLFGFHVVAWVVEGFRS